MFYPQLTDTLAPLVAPTGTANQVCVFKLKQETGVRAEMLNVKVRLTTNAAALTGAAWGGLAGAVKEIRVIASDALGKRNVVRMSGIALLMFAQQNLLNLDGQTQIAYASSVSFPLSTTVEVTYPVPLRHPSFGDPFGNQLSLPLSANFVKDDVTVEVEFNDISAGGAVFTTNPPTYASVEPLLMEVNYREVPESVPYIPSELLSDSASFSSTSKVYLEIPAGGYLTGLGIQGLSTSFGNATTRVALINSSGAAGNLVKIDLNRKNIVTTNQELVQARNDRSRVMYPRSVSAVIAASFLHARNFAGEMYFDFISDVHGFDVFSAASALNLDPNLTGGYKLRCTFSDLASSAYVAHWHTHKLLPVDNSQINALSVGL